MIKNAFIVLGILVFFGAGCTGTKPIGAPPDTSMKATPKLAVMSEADFVRGTMEMDSVWLTYTNSDAKASFRYPSELFLETKKYGEQVSGMSFSISAKPIASEDGVCGGLGDIDCEIITWPKRYENFKGALQGSTYTYGLYESIPVAQQVRRVNGAEYVTIINQGVNGACVLSYIRATPSAYVTFQVNICDDPRLESSLWSGTKVSEVERQKAEDIVAGKNLADSTRIKIQAMERVLATLELK